MKTCDFGQRISAYADAELSAAEMREVEAHLAGCVLCREELAAIRQVREAVAGWAMPSMSQIGVARMHQMLEIEARRGARSLRRVAVSLAGMAACLAVVTTVMADRQVQSAPPAVWEQVALSPMGTAAADEASEQAVATAQWVVADLGGTERE